MREKSNESIKNVNYNTTLLADDRGEITQTKEVYFKRFEEEVSEFINNNAQHMICI